MGRVRQALQQLCRLGMRAAFLSSSDGLLIDAVTCPDERLDLDRIVASVTSEMQSGKWASDPLRPPRSVVVQLEGGAALVIRPAGEDVVGAVLATNEAALGRIRLELQRLMPEVAAAGSGEPLDLLTFISDALGSGTSEPTRPQPAAVEPPRQELREIAVPVQLDGPSGPAPGPVPEPIVAAPGSVGVVPRNDAILEPHLPAEPALTAAEPPRPVPASAPQQSGPSDERLVESPHEPDPGWQPRQRLILEGVGLSITGQAATATVDLAYGTRRYTGKVVARDSREQRRVLIAEATARAVTAVLPNGYGVSLVGINPTLPDEEVLVAKVFLLTPNSEETLFGVAPLDDEFRAAAKAVLSAVNRRIAPLL